MASVRSWLPPSFLRKFQCGILEWPGQGEASEARPPECLDSFLDDLAAVLPARRLPVVGFCMGGIAAWAFAQRHPGLVRRVVLVESPLQFPLVLAPLLIPGIGRTLLRAAQQSRMGRALVSKAILRGDVLYTRDFLDSLFAYDAGIALHYIRLFKGYSDRLAEAKKPLVSLSPCWRLIGMHSVRVLTPTLGRRHRIEASTRCLKGAGHFPAVEAPETFFESLEAALG